jgi:hypothetical protein
MVPLSTKLIQPDNGIDEMKNTGAAIFNKKKS